MVKLLLNKWHMNKHKPYHTPQCTYTYRLYPDLCTSSDRRTPNIYDETSTEPLYGRAFTPWTDDETLDNTP